MSPRQGTPPSASRAGPVVPRATYRLQLQPDFGFDAAAEVAGYLAELGVSHAYLSPYLQAAPGSLHGYDVVDHSRPSAELGGAAGHARLCAALAGLGLGQVIDIVANHMAIGRKNQWWQDVLENGPASAFAAYFDVDWDPPEARLQNSILLPVLADHYGRVLEAGGLRIHRDGPQFSIRYEEQVFPLSPESLDQLLGEAARQSGCDELAFIADSLGRLPVPVASDWEGVARRHRDLAVLETELARALDEIPRAAAAIDKVIDALNRDYDALDVLLERQNYRLARWRAAGRDLGYRRFFDINSLVGLRVEEPRVFRDTHALILEWVREGLVDGLRIDHVDGLRDPEEYLERLRAAAPHAWIVVEKILEPREALRTSWPIAGTTGYDFLNTVGGLFVDPAGRAALTTTYADFTGEPASAAAVLHDCRQLVLRHVLGSDLNRLTALFVEVCERHRRYRDFTRHELQEALREVIGAFPVYRTYVRAEDGAVGRDDTRHVSAAIRSAAEARPDLDPGLFAFLADLLLLRVRGDRETELVMRFQQLTGPAMAKGVEDTALYRFHRLVSLNEVGGDPARVGVSVEAFHRACETRQRRWPIAMLTTGTHDTKRSDDVRLRIHLLSEIPHRWAEAVARWSALATRHRRGDLPDRNAEYLLYQTLVGAWPIERDRLWAYMEKAVREGKQHTSWTDPDAAYEDALRAFVEGVVGDAEIRADVEAFLAPLLPHARVSSLAQTLLTFAAPGVPDLYQGAELWTSSLVDPDNRRPVDYALRRRLLRELDGASPDAVMARMEEGLPKLWVIRQALAVRRGAPGCFGPDATYRPLAAEGARAAHVVAFARGSRAGRTAEERVVAVAPRLCVQLAGRWGDTTLPLPDGTWHDVLSGGDWAGTVALRELLARFPVALLSRNDAA